MEENKKEPIQIQISGEVYEVPAAPPADFMLKIIRMEQKNGKESELGVQETYDLLLNIFSKETLDPIAKKLTFDQLSELLKMVLDQQMKSMTDEGKQKTAVTVKAS